MHAHIHSAQNLRFFLASGAHHPDRFCGQHADPKINGGAEPDRQQARIINKLASKTDCLKNSPMYIMINPTKTKLNANVLILLILLEYFAMSIPLSFNYSTKQMAYSSCFRKKREE